MLDAEWTRKSGGAVNLPFQVAERCAAQNEECSRGCDFRKNQTRRYGHEQQEQARNVGRSPENRRQDKECATGAAFWHIRMPRACGADRRETRPIFSFGREDPSVSVRVPKPKWKHGRVQKKRRAPPAAPTNITFPHETSGGKDASGISQNDQKNQNKEELIAEKQDKSYAAIHSHYRCGTAAAHRCAHAPARVQELQ